MKKSHSNLRLNGRLAEQKKQSEKVFTGDLLHVFKDEASFQMLVLAEENG